MWCKIPAPHATRYGCTASVCAPRGLRPVQIWVPDVRARSFVAAARKQAKAVAASEHAKSDERFIEAVSGHLAE